MTATRINPQPVTEDVTQSGTVPANGAATVSFALPTIPGYTPTGVIMSRPSTGAQSLTCVSTNISGSTLYTNWRNFTASAVAASFLVRVLYMPS